MLFNVKNTVEKKKNSQSYQKIHIFTAVSNKPIIINP